MSSVSLNEVAQVREEADCLWSQQQVMKALDKMAAALSVRIADQHPLLLTVMNGAVIPMGYLLTRLDFPLQVDYIHATRYGEALSGGALEWIARPRIGLSGRTVVIVDDIHDEGGTLHALSQWCGEQGAKEVVTVTLVTKLHDRKIAEPSDFNALTVPDRYVFGFGMDYKGYLRNMPGIYALSE
ncbi:MAG: hypoxanthine-guanine phosphoribosyltransferase [Gammaproteobacteria bacterium]|jgi:hypoxanthine phosphoribosyltransferase|nr:hypoxanthine-guanine phosphoribosyltransferase [Gammaproteobacteria bacterium]MBT3489275.1 hypoxanthine-guanine phosphoribosyltransferase [Gammaproteobacteria bacterium]MBT3717813.1 hypoxanthine-guanine phosphoribosyltransferase [Gammaproteobacteria bacterium]MBT3845990.1 hypoxanthine-guanine phosphoribosyltransferase [Gammaproteobacteria bacterium]MBT3893807.1 hypoxanthine-guanine phosphoribosyltransferase [Gammaproteobacteria bacterium]